MRSRGLLFALVSLAIAACATGPQLSTLSDYLKPPAPEHGRIYFYRTGSPVGAMVQPSIRLNGEVIGSAVPGGVFFADRLPGNYSVSVATETERSLSLNIVAGQVYYVRFDISMGFLVGRVSPSLIPADSGATEVAQLAFVGGSLPASKETAPSGTGATGTPDVKVLNRAFLTRTEVQAIMSRVWEFARGDDGHLVRWEFRGTTLYGTNITNPGRYSADWRFNERSELCVFWTTRRSIDRCVLLAREGEKLVMIDAKSPDRVFASVELK